MLVGVPDGMGAMLKDDSTVRIIFQSESYGPMYYESYPFIVNPDGVSFTGSHVMYVDYDRDGLARFMSHGESAEGLVKDAGNLIESVVNLKGNLVEKRSEDGCTAHPHYSNTDPNGRGMWTDIMNTGTPTDTPYLSALASGIYASVYTRGCCSLVALVLKASSRVPHVISTGQASLCIRSNGTTLL